MARRKRGFTTFNRSFLDIMSCGFGAVVLVFLIIDHSIEVQSRELNRDLLSEVNLLEEDISDGEAGLVRLRNALDEVDLQIVEARGRATRVTEQISEYEALIASLRQDSSDSTDL
ncbi:MAG: VWA domain-containing protein, partial [Haliea sp.]